MFQGVKMLRCTSISRSSPRRPCSTASLTAIIIGEKRSWKLIADFSFLARQMSRMARAWAWSAPIGFWISAAAPSGSWGRMPAMTCGGVAMS